MIRHAELLAIPLELAMVFVVVRSMRRGPAKLREAGANLDVPERIALATRHALPAARLADVFATELSILFYALASWRRPPFVPEGSVAFTYHRENALAAILATVLLAATAELVAGHFLLRVWSERAAWILTALSAVAVLWLLGVLRAVVLRPVLLDERTLHLRAGIQWRGEIPLSLIEGADFGHVKAPARATPGALRARLAALPHEPTGADRS